MKKTMLRIILFLLMTMLLCQASAQGLPIYYQLGTKAPEVDEVEFIAHCPFEEDEAILTIDFLGIYRGDSIVISCGGKRMLIDGGPEFKIGAVERYLQFNQIEGKDAFDAFLLTHAHDDHIEVPGILLGKGYQPAVQYSPYNLESTYELWRQYVPKLEKSGIEHRKLVTGDVIDFGGAKMTVWRWDKKGIDINNHCLVTMVEFGDAKILLTADIGADAQKWMLENFDRSLFKSDIYKIPHHGIDRLFYPYFDTVAPQLVIITNQKSSAERLEKALQNRRVPRYYINRTIRLETNGKLWYVTTQPAP